MVAPAPTTNNVTRPRAFGFGCALNGRLFRLANGFGADLTIETAPTEAPRVDTSSSPEEIVDESGRVFARSAFSGGEGLFQAHQPEAERDRYWDSRGINAVPERPGEFPRIQLTREMELVSPSAESALRAITDGDSVWFAEGDELLRTDDPDADTPVFVSEDVHVGGTAVPVGGIALLGEVVYAAVGPNGITRKVAGAWESWSNLEATRLWSVKGRIVASDGDSLYEVLDGGAAPAPILTLPAGREWTGVVDGGDFVLASATDGYVYAFTSDEGQLVLVAQTLFEGEQPTSVGQAQGVVGIGTRQGDIGRLWVGTLTERGVIANLQLKREWLDDGSGVNRQPFAITGDRTALYTAVALGGTVDVWRLELTTLGLSRYLTVDAEGCSHGLFVRQGRVWLTVCGSGLWRETDAFVESGYLIGPLGDFFNASEKSWVGARIEHSTLDGQRIELYYTTDPDALADPDSSSWVRVLSRSTGTTTEEIALQGVTGRALAGQVRLFPSNERDSTPSVRSFSFRAYGSAGDDDVIITLPVNISDQLERRGRHRVRVKGAGEQAYRDLKGLEGRPVLLRIYEPSEVVRGLVESVGAPVQASLRRRSNTTIALVRVRGRRSSTGALVVDGTFGASLWGERPWGGF